MLSWSLSTLVSSSTSKQKETIYEVIIYPEKLESLNLHIMFDVAHKECSKYEFFI